MCVYNSVTVRYRILRSSPIIPYLQYVSVLDTKYYSYPLGLCLSVVLDSHFLMKTDGLFSKFFTTKELAWSWIFTHVSGMQEIFIRKIYNHISKYICCCYFSYFLLQTQFQKQKSLCVTADKNNRFTFSLKHTVFLYVLVMSILLVGDNRK